MTRIDQARQGYLTNNFDLQKQAHSKDKIEESLAHDEDHLSQFFLPEIILGGQDGLVNVLGVILGVAAATQDNNIVTVAGLAATFAESISMAAVAYTSTIAEADYYQSEYEREKWEIEHLPEGEKQEIHALYHKYGFKGKILEDIVNKITSDKNIWLKVMMEQELRLTPVARRDARPKAAVVGVSAIIGSFIPLIPFFFMSLIQAIILSISISALSLFFVGFYKAKKTLGRKYFRSGLEMTIIGMVSALIGYVIGTIFKV